MCPPGTTRVPVLMGLKYKGRSSKTTIKSKETMRDSLKLLLKLGIGIGMIYFVHGKFYQPSGLISPYLYSLLVDWCNRYSSKV